MNKVIYDNWLMRSSSGEELCYFSEKKAMWYLGKNLAIQIGDKEIELVFDPADRFGVEKIESVACLRDNICCKCGTGENLTKHHIVPYSYKKNFPDEYKEHMWQDVTPLCRGCHDLYEKMAEPLRQEIEEPYKQRIKVFNKTKRILEALLFHREDMDELRYNQMLEQARQLCGIQGFSDGEMEKEYEKMVNRGKLNIFKLIVKDTVDSGNMEDFIVMWRRHFLENFDPPYMPDDWAVENPVKNRKIE